MMGRTFRKRTKRRRTKTSSLDECSNRSHCRPTQYAQLMKWMVQYGFTGSNLQAAFFQDTGRGLKAVTDIKSGDILLRIPRQLLITTSMVLKSELGPLIKSHYPLMTSHQMLAVYLLLEDSKDSQSFWFPYISALPCSFSVPAFFDKEELHLLPKCSYLSAEIQIRRVETSFEELSHFFRVLKQVYPSVASVLTYERFCWAWFAVNTRCVYMACEKRQDNFIMVPFLDLLNHSPSARTEAYFDVSLDSYILKTYTSYKKRGQVFISYGPHENSKLLLEYGFIVPYNSHDAVHFDIDDISCCTEADILSTDLHKRKLQILRESKLHDDLCCGWDGLSWRLVTALKIMCMDETEIHSWKRIYESTDLSATNCEVKAKELARKLLTANLHNNQKALQTIENMKRKMKLLTGHLCLIEGLRKQQEQLLQLSLKELRSEHNCI